MRRSFKCPTAEKQPTDLKKNPLVAFDPLEKVLSAIIIPENE
jgi:hypothetical protein